MEQKKGIIFLAIAVVLVGLVGGFLYIKNLPKEVEAPVIDPVEQAKVLEAVDKFEVFGGVLTGITEEDLTLKTSDDVLTIKKLSVTRYVVLSGGTSEPIAESNLQQNERAVVIVGVDMQTGELTAISVAVVRE